ncbi:hypothetical protein CR513_25464, partial [Mucuna pruriens]
MEYMPLKTQTSSFFVSQLEMIVIVCKFFHNVSHSKPLVYGTVMFPHGDDFIDLAAIDVYLSKRDRGENPTIALLTNTYYTLNHCCERKGGNLRCCSHLLYLWLTTHLFHSKRKTASDRRPQMVLD